jgi:hypothetical protein
MANAVTAAESLGLGTCCVGYARTCNPEKTTEFLGLPKGVSVVCGLAIGWPNEMPDLKPKLPRDLVVFGDRYRHDEEVMKEELQAYDDEVTQFNQQRNESTTDNDWISHILDYHREAAAKHKQEAVLKARDFNITM